MTTDKNFKPGQRRGAAQMLSLADAYNAVFTDRKPTVDALQTVMADLAEFSGYFAVSLPSASDAELRDMNGRRAVFARILSLTKLSPQELTQLREAALVEMQISNVEGER